MKTSLTRGFKEQEGVAYLGKRTVKHHHALISSILTTAVKWQVILENPAKRVKAPKAPRLEAKFMDELQTDLMRIECCMKFVSLSVMELMAIFIFYSLLMNIAAEIIIHIKQSIN